MKNNILINFAELMKLCHELGIFVYLEEKERVTANGIETVGYAYLSRDGYEIHLANRVPEDVKTIVLAHELAHVIRGDFLVRGVRLDLANIAMDCVINAGLPVESLLQIGVEPVDPVSLKKYYGIDVDVKKGWRPIYQKLAAQENSSQQNGAGNNSNEDHQDNSQSSGGSSQEGGGKKERAPNGGNGFPNGGMDQIFVDPSLTEEEKEEIHSRIEANALAASKESQEAMDKIGANPAKDLSEALNKSIRSIGKGGNEIRELPRESKTARNIGAIVNAIKRLLHGSCGGFSNKYRRTYTREGRTPFLRGTVRKRQEKLVVILDASGSMDVLLPLALGVSSRLEAEFDLTRIVFASSAAIVPSFRVSRNIGYGTCLQSAYKLIPRDATVCVVLSDMLIDDFDPRPEWIKVVWCVLGKDGKPKALPQDVVIEIEE